MTSGKTTALTRWAFVGKCESWTLKKTEHQRIDAFELWCWRRLLTVPWTARRSNQSILKEINPEYSLEGLILKVQHSGNLMQRANWNRHWCWEILMAGEEGGDRGRDCWMVSWLNGQEFVQSPGDTERTGKPGMLQSMGSQRVRHDLVTDHQ